MTILFVTHYTELYGANRSMLTLVLLLQSKYAIRPIIIVPNSEGALIESLQEHNIQYYVMSSFWWILTYLEPLPSAKSNLKQQLKNILYALRLKKLLKSEQIDAVYSNSVTIDLGALLAFMMRVPHIWHFRESIHQFRLKLTMPRILSQLIIHLHTNKRFILLSDFMVREYQHVLPLSKVCRIYNGVSLPINNAQRIKNQVNGKLQIACVGQLSSHKNQMELLKALTILKERQIDVHAHFVGVDAPGYLDEMNGFIEKHKLERMVTIHGHSNEVFSILGKCNLGVVMAKDEAFGRVTIEYMLMRMPVVAADSGANPELIDDGETGKIYQLGNVYGLADAIQMYVDSPDLLEAQGEKAYLKAVSKFSAERNADLIYKEILNVVKA